MKRKPYHRRADGSLVKIVNGEPVVSKKKKTVTQLPKGAAAFLGKLTSAVTVRPSK